MGDLELDTRVTVVDEGRLTATPVEDWRIWSPMGGYIASIALRAAATAVPDGLRPASFTCQFLAAARFEPVDLALDVRRSSRRAASIAVSITQDGSPILDAQTWFAAEADLLEHDHADSGGAGRPEDHRPIQELTDEAPPFPFWENFDGRPVDWIDDWEIYTGGEPRWKQWLRFLPQASFDDPVMEACRLLALADLPSWPAITRAYARDTAFGHYVAPSLDLSVQFHRLANSSAERSPRPPDAQTASSVVHFATKTCALAPQNRRVCRLTKWSSGSVAWPNVQRHHQRVPIRHG